MCAYIVNPRASRTSWRLRMRQREHDEWSQSSAASKSSSWPRWKQVFGIDLLLFIVLLSVSFFKHSDKAASPIKQLYSKTTFNFFKKAMDHKFPCNDQKPYPRKQLCKLPMLPMCYAAFGLLARRLFEGRFTLGQMCARKLLSKR